MLDLLDIAKTEAAGGDLGGLLARLFEPSEIRPTGYPDAVIFEGGNHDGNVNPVAHSLTDAYALLGTLAATDVLGLPFYAVPMWAQYRHDLKLAPLAWFRAGGAAEILFRPADADDLVQFLAATPSDIPVTQR